MRQEFPNAVQRSDDHEAAYRRNFHRLVAMASRKLGLPRDRVADLVHDLFVKLLTGRYDVHNLDAWLTVALLNGGREVRSELCRPDRVHVDVEDHLDRIGQDPREAWDNSLLVRRVIASLATRDQELLRLHYLEGYTANEIAGRLGTTPRYAEKLIHEALTHARRVFTAPEDSR